MEFDFGKNDNQSVQTYFSEEELIQIAKKNEVAEADEDDNSCLMEVECPLVLLFHLSCTNGLQLGV